MPWKSNPPHEERDILARTIWGEARSELYGGRVAIWCVIQNRIISNTWYGNDIIAVCQKPWQFSCWNPKDPNRVKVEAVDMTDSDFRECMDVAELGMKGEFPDITFGSTHYFTATIGVSPSWAKGKHPIIKIGAHLFFHDVA